MAEAGLSISCFAVKFAHFVSLLMPGSTTSIKCEYLVFLDGTLLATNRTVPEAEEPWRRGGAGEREGGALPGDRPQPRQPRHHLHPSHPLLTHQEKGE